MSSIRALALFALGPLLACTPEAGPAHAAPGAPRVVSLGGTLTEAVFALGVGELVVGADTSSTYPHPVRELPMVGYNRAISPEGVASLGPTVVIHTEETGPPAALAQLANLGIELVEFEAPKDVATAKQHLRALGVHFGAEARAAELVATLERDLEELHQRVAADPRRPLVAFLYGRGGGTLMLAGQATEAQTMIELAGGRFPDVGFQGFKPFSAEAIVEMDPEYILMMSQGLESIGGSEAVHALPGVALTRAAQPGRLVAVDDLALLGFGPRMGSAALEVFEAIHPVEPR